MSEFQIWLLRTGRVGKILMIEQEASHEGESKLKFK